MDRYSREFFRPCGSISLGANLPESTTGIQARPFAALLDEQQQRKACKALWDGVLLQALKDCSGKPTFDHLDVAQASGRTLAEFVKAPREERDRLRRDTKERLIRKAMRWVSSEDTHVGSCAWICKVFDYDQKRVRAVAKSINESGFQNYVDKTGLHAVLWHVQHSAPTYSYGGDGILPGVRREVKLYEEESE